LLSAFVSGNEHKRTKFQRKDKDIFLQRQSSCVILLTNYCIRYDISRKIAIFVVDQPKNQQP
jgi:hypothetical protein